MIGSSWPYGASGVEWVKPSGVQNTIFVVNANLLVYELNLRNEIVDHLFSSFLKVISRYSSLVLCC